MSESDLWQALNALVARLSRTPRKGRPALIRQLLPLLANGRLPSSLRIAGAARVLRFIPDRTAPVRRVVRALTAGLSPLKALDRLRQLQHQVDKCDTLNTLIDERERDLELACPRCRKRLPRVEMIKHLWHEHRLIFERGKTRTLKRAIAALRAQHATSGNLEPLDRAVGLAGLTGLRQLLAEDDPLAEELVPLLAEAAERRAGLCPGCFANLPAGIQGMPPPLSLANGRLSGDGFALEIRWNRWLQTLRVTTPDRKTATGRRSLTPRGAATLAAAFLLLLTVVFTHSTAYVLAGFLLALGAYVGIRFTRTTSESRKDQLIEIAWHRVDLMPDDQGRVARYLTRLCLASMRRGDPESRAAVLNRIADRARDQCTQSDAELQLLAAISVLQVEDASKYGRDVVAGIAALAADGFAGSLSADYAEYAVECYLTRERDPGDIARLRILLLAAAFEARLVPRDLFRLWAGAPCLKRSMAMEPALRIGLLFGVWRTRGAQAWQAIGHAETVFELARTSPPTASRILAKFPDLLLLHRPQLKVEDLIGPLLICSRGVAVGGYMTADPDAAVHLAAGGRELIYGRHRLELAGKLPVEFVEVIRQWLRFRAESLVPFIDGYLSPGAGESSSRVLRPFCRRCLACGTVSAVSVGEVGRRVPN